MPIFPVTDIYGITDSVHNLGRSNVEQVKEMLRADIKVIQYREKNLGLEEMMEECTEIRRLTRDAGCCFIVNDHVELALFSEADGVHVGQDDMPLNLVREFMGDFRLVGVSTHSPEEAAAAVEGKADYIGVGPIFATKTKETKGPLGLGHLADMARTCPLPQVVIGGINETNIKEVVKHGGRCIAMVTAITLAPDIPAKAAELRRLMSEARQG